MNIKKYFLYDNEGEGFQTFATLQERDQAAKAAIAEYLADGWNEAVAGVVCGEVTHKANITYTQTAKRPHTHHSYGWQPVNINNQARH